jgi:hypothetical protein
MENLENKNNEISLWQLIKSTFLDSHGKGSAARMCAFTCMMILIAITGFDQLTLHKANLKIFEWWFFLLIVSLGFTASVIKIIYAVRGIKEGPTDAK